MRFRRFATTITAAAAVMLGMTFVGPVAPAAAVDSTTAELAYWNETMLQAFRSEAGSPTLGPTTLSRAAAILHSGLFDVLNSAWGHRAGFGAVQEYDAYLTYYNPGPNVNSILATGLAARDLLSYALPDQSSYFASKYTSRYGTATQAEATALAGAIVNGEKTARNNDGSTSTTPYVLDGVAGSWRPTGGPGCPVGSGGAYAVTPNWGRVKPFIMAAGNSYRKPLPGGYPSYATLLASTFYANNVNQVESLGSKTSTTRTAQQTQSAFFWANDVTGTYRPPGQLLETTESVIAAANVPFLQASRDYALVSLALGDAAIAAWDQKFDTPLDLWRPISAIQLAATDNNPATTADPTWTPLTSSGTPCFPSWVSGHAEFAGAWAAVMSNQFGSNTTFTVHTDDPNARGVVRTYTSFTAAANEMAESRVYLGVHYQFDSDDGLSSGNAVGTNAMSALLPTHCSTVCT